MDRVSKIVNSFIKRSYNPISESSEYQKTLDEVSKYVVKEFGDNVQPYRDSIILYYARKYGLDYNDLMVTVEKLKPPVLPPYGGESVRW